MQLQSKIAILALCCMALVHCTRKADDFKEFFENKEITYPGVPVKIIPAPGKNRVAFFCLPSPDRSIVKYVVYWNNKADSVVFNVAPPKQGDTLKLIIPNLNEYSYSFVLYTYDGQGNRSVPVDVNNVRSYGDIYESRLLNRGYNTIEPYVVNPDGSVKLNFVTPDTINVGTIIRYTTTADLLKDAILEAEQTSITLPDFKAGTRIAYRSSYVPVLNSIDTFHVTKFDTFPPIFMICDKSLFSEVHLPNDVQTYESGTSISKLWDGSTTPQGYPNIFHSDGNHLPHVLTFDMGKLYNNVNRIEETGRDCCNNPTRFEVWGIADLTNATTTLRGDDAGWKDEAIAKGWVLLGEVIRTDDGKAAVRQDLIENPPPVRYIRIRVINTSTGSTYSNMSELTFWNK